MRRCKITPRACRRTSAPCCADCGEENCQVRCENSPKRCNCWEDKPPAKAREHKVSALQVVFLHERGSTQKEIAAQLGCGRSTVCKILQEMGVTRGG